MFDVFVKISGAERLSKLSSKNLCTGCLYPGAVKGPKHKCFFTNFCCPSNVHDEMIHILLCENHKKDDANIKLVGKFNDKFIVPLPGTISITISLSMKITI